MSLFYADIRNPEVFKLVKSAFPAYNGQKVKLLAVDRVTLDNRFWDGGTKSEWRALDLATLVVSAPQIDGFANPPQFGGPLNNPVVVLEHNRAIVEHGIFCGKDSGITIYLHPSNLNPTMLPRKHVLTQVETTVLGVIRGFKGGAYRQEALQRIPNYQEVITSLVTRGLLKQNKLGAISITLDGKNALA